MSNDKMREEFEYWVLTVAENTQFARFTTGERQGDYKAFRVQLCWWAWNASRAAIVVDLPGTEGVGMYSEAAARVAIDCCADALQDAGIKWSRP